MTDPALIIDPEYESVNREQHSVFIANYVAQLQVQESVKGEYGKVTLYKEVNTGVVYSQVWLLNSKYKRYWKKAYIFLVRKGL